jgi:hypothetical protein
VSVILVSKCKNITFHINLKCTLLYEASMHGAWWWQSCMDILLAEFILLNLAYLLVTEIPDMENVFKTVVDISSYLMLVV